MRRALVITNLILWPAAAIFFLWLGIAVYLNKKETKTKDAEKATNCGDLVFSCNLCYLDHSHAIAYSGNIHLHGRDQSLIIILGVSNTSTNKKEDYISPSLTGDATLKDEFGNIYAISTFRDNETIIYRKKDGQYKSFMSGSVHPGNIVEDALVFEPPIKQAKTLFLTIRCRNGKYATITFPVSKITA